MAEDTIEQAADRAAAAAGDFAAARSMLERAVEVDVSSHELWMKLSAMRKASGDVRAALEALDRGLAICELWVPALSTSEPGAVAAVIAASGPSFTSA